MYSSNILKHVTFVQNKIQSTDILLFYYIAQDSKLHYFHMMNVIIKQLYWASMCQQLIHLLFIYIV